MALPNPFIIVISLHEVAVLVSGARWSDLGESITRAIVKLRTNM